MLHNLCRHCHFLISLRFIGHMYVTNKTIKPSQSFIKVVVSGKWFWAKKNWKTEEKAKVQDCVHCFCERVRNSSSHTPLQTFSQWFQPNSLVCFLHLITFVIIILVILLIEVSYILCVCVSVCVCIILVFHIVYSVVIDMVHLLSADPVTT